MDPKKVSQVFKAERNSKFVCKYFECSIIFFFEKVSPKDCPIVAIHLGNMNPALSATHYITLRLNLQFTLYFLVLFLFCLLLFFFVLIIRCACKVNWLHSILQHYGRYSIDIGVHNRKIVFSSSLSIKLITVHSSCSRNTHKHIHTSSVQQSGCYFD